MKTFRLLAVSLCLTAVFAVAGFAQATKVALINTYAFSNEKEGITKYVNAIVSINNEFKPLNEELKTIQTKLQALATDIENLQKLQASNPKAVDQNAVQAKVEEAERLQRELKFKQDEGKTRIDKRQQAVLGPLYLEIMKAVQEYSKQKGYALVFDVGKLAESEILLGVDEKADITKEFIAYYNARPTATAASATPK